MRILLIAVQLPFLLEGTWASWQNIKTGEKLCQ